MATTSGSHFLLTILTVISASLFVSAVNADDPFAFLICAKISDPPFCREIVQYRPGALNTLTTLHSIQIFSLKIGFVKAQAHSKKLRMSAAQEPNVERRVSFAACEDLYKRATKAYEVALDNCRARKFGVEAKLNQVSDDIEKCEKKLKDNGIEYEGGDYQKRLVGLNKELMKIEIARSPTSHSK